MNIDELTPNEETAIWASFDEYQELTATLAIETKPSLEFFWLNELRNHPDYYITGERFLARNPNNYITTAKRGGAMPVDVRGSHRSRRPNQSKKRSSNG